MKLENDFFTIENIISVDGEPREVELNLNTSHWVYDAHFPGNPVTPGVLILGIIGETMSRITGKALQLTHIKNLKFVEILTPSIGEGLKLMLRQLVQQPSEEGTPSLVKVRGELVGSIGIITKFSLIYNVTT